jgi:hypothetical protein
VEASRSIYPRTTTCKKHESRDPLDTLSTNKEQHRFGHFEILSRESFS